MSLPFFIARRYLFSKKKHNAINIISGISVCGVALATLALVCTLSVFNGFQDMVAGFFTAFDPELKITVREGKVFDPHEACIRQVHALSEIDVGRKHWKRMPWCSTRTARQWPSSREWRTISNSLHPSTACSMGRESSY